MKKENFRRKFLERLKQKILKFKKFSSSIRDSDFKASKSLSSGLREPTIAQLFTDYNVSKLEY